jgi:hypothetical protein
LLPLALAFGCSPAKIALDDSGSASDTDTGPSTVTDGALSATPASVDFGLLFVGQVGTQTVTIENVGESDVSVAVSLRGAAFAEYAVTLADPAPAPGATTDAVVTFTPTVAGEADAELVIVDTLGDADIAIPMVGQVQMDGDGDGVGSVASGGTDCDDTNAAVYPGATETWYDGVDADCAGDDDFDQDADGATNDVDCDDTDATVFPGAVEAWYDGIDGDCAGDDDFDQDADGYANDVDCNDTDPAVNPGAADTWYDGIDSDCAGNDDSDQDGDGVSVDTDCNDLDAAVFPGASDTWYDGIDSDCAGDDDYDQDLDGVDSPTDCNDTDPTVTGPVAETWNGIDDDCDGAIDDLSISDAASGALYGPTASLGLGTKYGLSIGGDLTGDGADDLVVASPSSGSGYAWVVSGASAATADGSVADYDTAALTGQSYYNLGYLVGPQHDLTGDGTADLLIAGSYSYYYYYYGRGWLLEGGSALTGSIGVTSTYTARFEGDSGNDALRWVVAGDIDGDGTPDVVTGCWNDNYSTGSYYGGDNSTGNVAVFAGGALSGEYDLGDSDDQIHGSAEDDYLGYALVTADLDGDGYDDILAGAPGVDTGATDGGAVYVFAGNATLDWDVRADDANAAEVISATRSRGFGTDPLATPGDVDGDGQIDLLLTSQTGGVAYLWWDASTVSGSLYASAADLTITGTAGATPSSASYAADLDGDGADEIVLGASGDDTMGADAGAAYVFAPAPGTSGTWTTANASATFYGAAAGDALGAGLASGGDADGDGRDDLLIGATGVDTVASGGGAVYVVLGQ